MGSEVCPRCGSRIVNAGCPTEWYECGCRVDMTEPWFDGTVDCKDRQIARLQSALEAAEETFTAPDGEVWNRPTAEAYYRACQALKKRREELLAAESARDDAVRERGRLRETLAAFLREVGELKVYYDTLLPQAKEVSDV